MRHRVCLPILCALVLTLSPAVAAPLPSRLCPIAAPAACVQLPLNGGTLSIALVAADTVRVQFQVGNAASVIPSPTLDPAWRPLSPADAIVREDGASLQLSTAQLHVTWDKRRHWLNIDDASGRRLLQQQLVASSTSGELRLTHAASDAMYGIGGYNATESVARGLQQQGQQQAVAGAQGHAGAPLVWSTAGYGLLVNGGAVRFTLQGTHLDVQTSAGSIDYFVIAGPPKQIFAALARLSGATPLFPKWAMGFSNSQWGIDQKELLSIVATYRSKHIPIDNFTLDFDWKAWGKDDYGEFRWNAEAFPDGPNGRLKSRLDASGMHLTGIMKPRVHVDTVEGRYATAHGFWITGRPASDDYFSHRPVRDIDFNNPAARAWFFNDALKHAFDTGIAGWWNDEADVSGDNTQFLNMQRALYDGQRAYSTQRVWSINRNFWLGAQRYAYGLWSGDIATGFASMAGQRARMLSAINVDAMQWGMDGGGFHGHPSDENYARWVEFGAFTPIFRVHGDFGEKRQPWIAGADAEKAATDAIRLRYALIPYIYSSEYARRVTGVGLVRPLIFDWPQDPQLRNDVDAWMFGDSLLVSPVVIKGQHSKIIYLPEGRWTDWFSGTVYAGGRRIPYTADSRHWHDIPLFVREGAIIPTQPPMDYVGQHPVVQLDVDIFPADRRTTFQYYDDDGSSYAYERGASFRQSFAVERRGAVVHVETGAPSGSYRPALTHYLLKIHGDTPVAITVEGHAMAAFAGLDQLLHEAGEGWASGRDIYGPVTYVRIASASARHLTLTRAASDPAR